MRSTPTRTCGREGVGRRPALEWDAGSARVEEAAERRGPLMSEPHSLGRGVDDADVDEMRRQQRGAVGNLRVRHLTTQYWPTFVDSSPGTPRMT